MTQVRSYSQGSRLAEHPQSFVTKAVNTPKTRLDLVHRGEKAVLRMTKRLVLHCDFGKFNSCVSLEGHTIVSLPFKPVGFQLRCQERCL